MNDTNVGRRDVLKKVGLFGAGALAGSILMSKAAEAAGVKTPIQPEGPFYPVREQVDKDADMTKVLGRVTEAEGSQFVLSGKVVDASSGAVIPGAMVEFWQACATGRYNHPSDTNSAVLDPNFQYWSQVKTDNEGRFSIKTIVPGAYPASDDWIRPSHIHVKVHKAGYPSLTTQIYFEGAPHNGTDQILQKLTPAQQKLVTISIETEEAEDGKIVAKANWTISLAKFSMTRPESMSEMTTPEIN